MKEYEFIEHTSDVGVRVYGRTQEELFKNAACALFRLLLVNYKPKQVKQKYIELEADTGEDLLVNWLGELIGGFFADKFLPAAYRITIEEAREKFILRAYLNGQEFNPYENKINMEVKAATRHNLKIEKGMRGFKAEIIFDV